MNIDKLNTDEAALIEIIRAFKFLRQEHYYENQISIGRRSNPSIIYYNHNVNRFVKVLGDENQGWTIVIQRKRIFDLKKDDSFFDISDYYQYFDSSMLKGKNYTLNSQVKFIQSNLMQVIRGKVWIDKLIKSR